MLLASLWAKHRLAILAALAVFGVKVLYVAFTSTRGFVMVPWIIDDSYINIRVARNIALGMGYSFNGIDPTNGTPFLWTYLTAINHLFFPLYTAVKATFLMSAFFGMLATLLAYAIAWKVTADRTTAWIALLLTALTSNAFLQALNGMDTAFFTFLVLWSVAAYLGFGRANIRSAFLSGGVIGIPVGLAVLTRGDGVFVAGAIGLCLLWKLWLTRAEPQAALQQLIGFCATAGLGLLVLMTWSILHTGHLLPANQVGRQAIAWGWHGALEGISVAKYLKVVGWNVFVLEHLVAIATGGSIVALAGFLYGVHRKDTRRFAAVTGIYCAAFLGTLVLYQWYFPDFHGLRYINPSVHLLLIFVAVALVDLFKGRHRWASLSCTVLALVALSGYSFYGLLNQWKGSEKMSYTGHPPQKDIDAFWRLYEWMKETIPPNTVIGIRDHGRFALFTDLPVQDLSGVIDPEIPKKVKEGGEALRDYLKQKNVAYLWVPSLEQRSDHLYQLLHGFLKLEAVPNVPPSKFEAHLYQIQWE